MEIKPGALTNNPPRLIVSFLVGFNAVANNIQLILFPLVLDLLLWFGPHLRLKDLLGPLITEMNTTLTQMATPDMAQLVQAAKDTWLSTVEHFNLLSSLRTYPIGIPSLFAASGPLQTPMGPAQIYELPNAALTFGGWAIVTLLGIIGGSIYFNEVARVTSPERAEVPFKRMIWQIVQSVLLGILLIVILMVIFVPASILISVLTMINPVLAQIAVLLISIIVLWLLIPLIFSPHGIFAFKQNAFVSILLSVRMVRYFLPTTGLFLMFVVLISQGLDILWRVPPESSWMALIGVLGHAFITTGLLSASFVYYRGGMSWMQQNIQRLTATPSAKA
ncbi:MAG: hypothetical protein P4L50_30680 [Anaerolineaceae bacterium]|nr:hypothetical protein [Anaerolineaceae bacterium]